MMGRHDATFHGEDLEMGYITHKLSGRNKLEGGKENADTSHRIALMKDCIVPTTVFSGARAGQAGTAGTWLPKSTKAVGRRTMCND
jgi:hypothetical protein